MEWVSYTQKNPGERFVQMSNWIDDPVPPLVCHAMDMNMKKLEKKVDNSSRRLVKWASFLVVSALLHN
ncbi:hypothetical protein Leryth_018190 [Lithospermum erythrorhizon]|nr:hypothetical protein Leryth_018190 [Lithospermum erythrorhizon]